MRFLFQHNHHSRLNGISFIYMASHRIPTASFFPIAPLTIPSSSSSSSSRRFFHSLCERILPALAFKPPINNNHRPLPLKTRTKDFSSVPRFTYPNPTEVLVDTRQFENLKIKLKELDIDIHNCAPGREHRLLCPMCKGGDSEELSLSLYIDDDGLSAVWLCFRGKCGWKGSTKTLADKKLSQRILNSKMKTIREITEESLELEPLCDELRGYFAERLIKSETLKRNRVMQKRSGSEVVIAFTYWRNGKLVNCKYRDINKRFWQEKDTETIFYGLDDIEEASDIIIVEGEMDKLSMEEAGFFNCVSVPDGAPAAVSKAVPPEEQVFPT